MSKRKLNSGGSVTGGTGDVKPQYFTISTGDAGAIDDYVTQAFVLPIARISTTKTKSVVFEILSVDYFLNMRNVLDNQTVEFAYLTTSTARNDGDTSSLIALADDLTLPRTLAPVVRVTEMLTTGATGFSFPQHVDTTDNNGNGILIATDRIIIVGGGIGNASVGNYTAKIKYRLTAVDITEFVGIVQSQQ